MVPRERTPHGIKWHDLTRISALRTMTELALPLPWLALSWVLYASPFWVFGGLASFMFFLCALRLNHEAIHGNLGLPRRGDTLVMFALSVLMTGSNHAVAFCHLQHHRSAMGPDDHEGACGHMTAWQVLKYGPRFPIDLNCRLGLGLPPLAASGCTGLAVYSRLRGRGDLVGLACPVSARIRHDHRTMPDRVFRRLDHPSGHNGKRPGRAQPTRPAGPIGLPDVLSPRTPPISQCPGQPPARPCRASGYPGSGICRHPDAGGGTV